MRKVNTSGRSSCCALNRVSCSSQRMFVLAEMCDVVRIEPRRFAQDTGQEIRDELNKKFANKVHYINELLERLLAKYMKVCY